MFPGLSFSAQVVHGNLASEGSPVSSSTGTSDTMKNASNTDKRITNEKKWYMKSAFRAQSNRWVINE